MTGEVEILLCLSYASAVLYFLCKVLGLVLTSAAPAPGFSPAGAAALAVVFELQGVTSSPLLMLLARGS